MVILTISISLLEKKKVELEWVSYIWYPITFKDQAQIKALLDLKKKVNVMSQIFAL